MQVVFPVNINSLGTVTEIDFSLTFDNTYLSNPVVQLGPNIGGNLTSAVGIGSVGAAVSNAVIPAGKGLLLTITFDLAPGGSGQSPLVWNKTPIYPKVIGPASNPNLSYGANTGLIDLATGAPQAVNIDILLEQQTATVVNTDPLPTPTPAPSVNPVPMPVQVEVAPTPVPMTIINPNPVTAATPTALDNLTASLSGITAHPVLLLAGGAAVLYFLSGSKKGSRSKKF